MFNRRRQNALLITATILSFSTPVAANTITWGGSSGNWYSGGWIGGSVPGINDMAVINSGTVNLGVDAVAAVNTLYQNHDGSGPLYPSGQVSFITGAGNLTTNSLIWYKGVQEGGGITNVNGDATLGDSNTNNDYQRLGVYGSGSRTLNLNGDSTLQSKYLDLDYGSIINNNGTFTNKGNVSGDTVEGNHISAGDDSSIFNNNGTFIQDASGKTSFVGVWFNNTGTVSVKSGTLVLHGGGTSTGDFITQADQTLSFSRSTYTLSSGSLNNLGNLEIIGATVNLNSDAVTYNNAGSTRLEYSHLNINGTGGFTNTGNIQIEAGSSLTSETNYSQSDGTTNVSGFLNASIIKIEGGSLSGDGTIIGNVINAGIVNPGNSPGRLGIQGDFIQLPDGELAIEIAGDMQGASYDWLDILGTVSLAGTLNVSFIDGYVPTNSNIYNILTYSAWDQSTFDVVTVSGLNLNQFTYSTIYSDTGVSLSISPVPEPSTYGLLLAGLGIITGVARRRNR